MGATCGGGKGKEHTSSKDRLENQDGGIAKKSSKQLAERTDLTLDRCSK